MLTALLRHPPDSGGRIGVPTAARTTARSPRAGPHWLFPNGSGFVQSAALPDQNRRDPTFPGCLYSEMKMCLAPCFAGCSKEEYDVEVQRLLRFLETRAADRCAASIEEEREKAAAAGLRARGGASQEIGKLDEVLRGRPELTRDTRSRCRNLAAHVEDQTIGVRSPRRPPGRAVFLRFAEIASQPRSAEQVFAIISIANATSVCRRIGEHLWLVGRWFTTAIPAR